MIRGGGQIDVDVRKSLSPIEKPRSSSVLLLLGDSIRGWVFLDRCAPTVEFVDNLGSFVRDGI